MRAGDDGMRAEDGFPDRLDRRLHRRFLMIVVGMACDHRSHELFDVPAVVLKRYANQSSNSICNGTSPGFRNLRGFDKPHSENLLPESVHRDAGCERFAGSTSHRQCQSIQAIFRGVLSCWEGTAEPDRTSSIGLLYRPLSKTKVFLGFSMSAITITLGSLRFRLSRSLTSPSFCFVNFAK